MPVSAVEPPSPTVTCRVAYFATQTANNIPELLPAGSVDAATRFVLANAIAFEGNWDIPFDPTHTVDGKFHVAGGGDIVAPIMYQERSLSVAQIAGGRIGMLPFQGDDLALLVLLPDDPDGLPQLELQLTGDMIAQAVASAYHYDERVQIALPRFALSETEDLSKLLPSLGVVSAFSPDFADLSGIDRARDLFVQSAFHDATITVNELGAAATAATAVVGGVTSAPPPFLADHSFAFAIFDNVTGSILFFGRVQDPTQS